MALVAAEAPLPVKLGAALYYMASSTVVQLANKVCSLALQHSICRSRCRALPLQYEGGQVPDLHSANLQRPERFNPSEATPALCATLRTRPAV